MQLPIVALGQNWEGAVKTLMLIIDSVANSDADLYKALGGTICNFTSILLCF